MNSDEQKLMQSLAEPFAPEHITWRAGTVKRDKTACMALAYGEFRAYMRRLDEVCGLDWTVSYEPWGSDRIICRLTIADRTRSSTGEMGAQDEKNEMGGTVAEAQAFKRACAMFGLGRYLYNLPDQWVDFDSEKNRIAPAGMAKLDAFYKNYYKANVKGGSAPTQASTPQPEPVPARYEAPAPNVAATAAKSNDTPAHKRLFAIGKQILGTDWEMARPWVVRQWTQNETDLKRESVSELSEDEKGLLGDYLNEHAKVIQERWPSQKKIMEKNNAQKAQAA